MFKERIIATAPPYKIFEFALFLIKLDSDFPLARLRRLVGFDYIPGIAEY